MIIMSLRFKQLILGVLLENNLLIDLLRVKKFI
jgi:hypothetical protein